MTQLFLIAKQKGEKHNMTKTTKRNWKRLGLTAGLGLGVSLIAAGCGNEDTGGGTPASPYKPTLLLNLPTACNTPDGMRLDPKTGDVILSCPNFFGITTPATRAPGRDDDVLSFAY